MNSPTPGARFRAALAAERPLQIAGAIHAYAAMLAERAGFRALYLSGAGVANASCGIPDLGFTTLDDVLTDVRRIVGATKLPLLVDADTGWGDPAATVRAMIVAPDHALQAPQSRTGGANKLQNAAQAVLCRRGRTGLRFGRILRRFILCGLRRCPPTASPRSRAGRRPAFGFRAPGAF